VRKTYLPEKENSRGKKGKNPLLGGVRRSNQGGLCNTVPSAGNAKRNKQPQKIATAKEGTYTVSHIRQRFK